MSTINVLKYYQYYCFFSRVYVLAFEPFDRNCSVTQNFLGRVSMSDAQVRVLSDLVQVYSKNTVQACQDIIAENGKIVYPFYLR